MPESVRQKTAAMFFEDFFLFEQPWEFDVRDIRPEVQASMHIWHGTGDKQVGCHARSQPYITGFPGISLGNLQVHVLAT